LAIFLGYGVLQILYLLPGQLPFVLLPVDYKKPPAFIHIHATLQTIPRLKPTTLNYQSGSTFK